MSHNDINSHLRAHACIYAHAILNTLTFTCYHILRAHKIVKSQTYIHV